MELPEVQRQYASQIAVLNSPLLQSSVNWLLANGYTLGNILAVVWANLPEIRAAISSPNPGISILTLLLKLLGEVATPPMQTTHLHI